MNIDFIRECLEETKSAYRSSKKNLLWLEQYRLENQNYRDYEGREILELLQNADDAQSSYVEVDLDSLRHILTIKNYGERTLVFTDTGMRSIMASYLSDKKNDTGNEGKLIGAKGLGFKSILNWTSEIKIKSDNIIVRFGDDVVKSFWDELRPNVQHPEEYEEEAEKDGHVVPLPILRIPEIDEWVDSKPTTTVIELKYSSDEIGVKIKNALSDFAPETLLFLHNLRNIRIIIDGKEREYTLEISCENDDLERCVINSTTWLVSRKQGKIDNRIYEVASAFNLDGKRQNSYNFFTFFPTDEEFPFPCILHATLELNASRKAIQTGEKINSTLMTMIAARIIALADVLKTRTHGWDAYKLISGNFKDKNYSDYAIELKTILEKETKDKEYIPILSGRRYSKANESYYYNDIFFDFIRENNGSEFFEKMMLKGGPNDIRGIVDPEAKEHIEAFVKDLYDNNILAKFIKIVYDYYTAKLTTRKKVELQLLKDDNNDVIKGTAYLNTGRKIADIPEFLNIKYVNDELKESLLREFQEQGSEQDQARTIATTLNDSITNISASDVSGIKKMLMLSRSDNNNYSSNQINNIIKCLFRLYISNTSEFEKSKIDCYLPTEAGGWRPAKELVFGDIRFPDGINRLNLCEAIYDGDDLVLYPQFLVEKEISAETTLNQTIQNFYAELGVNKYYRTEDVCYGNDKEYLLQNNISKDAISNASADRVGNGVNIVKIPIGLDKWVKLNLTDLIQLISVSGLVSQIVENIGLIWYYGRGWFGPEPLKINYLSYLLHKKTAAKRLSNYVLSTKEWIVDTDMSFEYNDKDDLLLLALKRLGAKSSYSDFTSNELYQLINAKASDCEKTGNTKGVKEFYHRIKMAFVEMGNDITIPDNVKLRMMCTKNGTTLFLDSREIFYSNNWNSKKLQSELPILSLQLRDGEDEVNRYFGCRRIKDLKVRIQDSKDNVSLCCELNKRIELCKPYILALTSKDYGDGIIYDRDKKNLIDRIYMTVVESASYYFEHDDIQTETEQMKDGEMILVEKIPMICCKLKSLEDALSDPQFCNVAAEAICIFLNLSSRDNIDRFYRILKASNRELEFLANNFTPELWLSCQGAYGISDDELDFWEHVFNANDKKSDFDKDRIKEGKNCYIADCLGISIERANVLNFNLFHIQQLQKVRNRYVAAYKIWLHEKCEGNRDMQRQYLRNINDFQSDSWIENALSNWEERYIISPNYDVLINNQLLERFNFRLYEFKATHSAVPKKNENYNYDGLELNIEDESLLYFDGNEEHFEQLRNNYICTETNEDKENPTNNKSEKEDTTPIKISIVVAEKSANKTLYKKPSNKRGYGNTRRKLSDSYLKKIGNEAEDKVLKALKTPDSEYEVGQIYSKHLNPVSGNDAQGYDLEYRRKGDKIFRCLEIKNFVGDSIIVSRHEYETAKSETYRDRYDVALVTSDGIQIWRNAFSDDSKYTKSSEDYIISFKINQIKQD